MFITYEFFSNPLSYGEPPGGGGAEAPAGAGRDQSETATAVSSGNPLWERAKALSHRRPNGATV